jgi:hypothetical protein
MPSLIPTIAITDEKETDHWYEIRPDGIIVPRFDCDLRDARAEQKAGGIGLLPSCSKIIHDMLSLPELATYKAHSTVDGTLDALLTRLDSWQPVARLSGETDAEYFKRAVAEFLPMKGTKAFLKAAVEAGKQKLELAAKHGTDVHSATEKFVKDGVLPDDDRPLVRANSQHVVDWLNANVKQVVFSERFVFSHFGYAGTSDLGVILKDGSRHIADIKTSGWKNKKGTQPFFKFGHPLQVSGYRNAAAECLDPAWADAGGIILHVNSNGRSAVIPQRFKPEDLDQYFEVYQGFVSGWQLKNNYRPSVERLPATFSIGSAPLTDPSHAADALEAAASTPACLPQR